MLSTYQCLVELFLLRASQSFISFDPFNLTIFLAQLSWFQSLYLVPQASLYLKRAQKRHRTTFECPITAQFSEQPHSS